MPPPRVRPPTPVLATIPEGSPGRFVGCGVHLTPGAPAPHANGTRSRIDLDALQRREVEHDSVVAHPKSAGVVPAAANGEQQLVTTRERDLAATPEWLAQRAMIAGRRSTSRCRPPAPGRTLDRTGPRADRRTSRRALGGLRPPHCRRHSWIPPVWLDGTRGSARGRSTLGMPYGPRRAQRWRGVSRASINISSGHLSCSSSHGARTSRSAELRSPWAIAPSRTDRGSPAPSPALSNKRSRDFSRSPVGSPPSARYCLGDVPGER